MPVKASVFFLMFVSNFTIAQTDLLFRSGFEFVPKLNDTGITWAGDYPNGNNTTCSSNIVLPQDCHQGRDATHNDDSDGHAGFSFVKLDELGNVLPDQSVDYSTNPWDCVRDNVTGLTWEVKTDDGGVHDKDHTYRWGGISATGLNHPNAEGTYYNDWDILVLVSNVGNGLCNFTDWRVPTAEELSGLVNQGVSFPSIDTNYFPNTAPANAAQSMYWTSTPFTSEPFSSTSGFARRISFLFGDEIVIERDASLHVRLVRGSGQ